MIYTLEKDLLQIQVNSLGAQLESLRHTNEPAEYIWQRQAYAWDQCAPVLFPFVARLKDNTAVIDGVPYEMPIHGFIQTMEADEVIETNQSLAFVFRSSSETLSCYPYHFQLTVLFEIEGSTLNQRFSVFNCDGRTIHFTLGAHPAFNCPLHPDEVFEDYDVTIDCVSNVPFLNSQGTLELGRLRSIPYSDGRIPLSHSLFADDALIFCNPKHKIAKLRHRHTKKGIQITFDHMNHLGIWSPKHVDAPFVCLEPWIGLPNIEGESKDFTQRADMISLDPGKQYETDFSLTPLF